VLRRPSRLPRRLAAAACLQISLLIAMLGPGAALAAGPPTPASGTFASDPSTSKLVSVVQFFDPNFIATRTVDGSLTGTISGPVKVTERVVSRTNGDFTFASTQVCDPCTVAGRTGAITLRLEGTGGGDDFQGRFTIVGGGTGDLANLHGHGTIVGSRLTSSGTYSGELTFGGP